MKRNKLSTGLLSVLADFEQQTSTDLTSHARLTGLVLSAADLKPARIPVFIRCDAQDSLQDLADKGILVNQKQGEIRTAFLPVDSLGLLTEDPRIQRVHASRKLRPRMDLASAKVSLPGFRTRTHLTGKGVIVGVVDSGIDPNHPAFAGRILRIWDQTLTGTGVDEGHFGQEFTGPALTGSRDTNGHGTHVSGIAAGSDVTFGGVAPSAEIVMVKTNFLDSGIADGIRYIFRIAQELGRPAVINLSLGGHFDAHDGSDPLAQIIDTESGPGRIVCCAAGNEGDQAIHAQVTLTTGVTAEISMRVEANMPVGLLNGWYSGKDRMEIAVRSPSGFQTAFQRASATRPTRDSTLNDGKVRIITPSADPTNHDFHFTVEIQPAPGGGLPALSGNWKLLVRAVKAVRGIVDVWAPEDESGLHFDFTGPTAQDTMKIGSPGCAADAITVASFTTRNQWQDKQGNTRGVQFPLNDISSFSSEGPLRNGLPKPDVTAPGAMIIAPLSADTANIDPAFIVSNTFRVDAGTSMATPFVTGVVALLLEGNATLTPLQIKALLAANSAIPGSVVGAFNTKWGHGLLDATNL